MDSLLKALMFARLTGDYERARRRAETRRLLRALLRKRQVLKSLAEAEAECDKRSSARAYRGLRTVPVSSIVGSVDRHQDFDHCFYPLEPVEQARWERVNRATVAGEPLPPVRLVKCGEHYFVEDGHHRVSVARYQGMQFIDAEVVEQAA